MGEGESAQGAGAEVDDAASVRRFLDMSIDLLGICDLQTHVLEVSDSWERLLGWSRDDLMGTPLIDYFHPDDLPQIEAELAGLLLGGDAVAVVVRVRRKDGSYCWVQGNARSDLEAERIYVTAADLTERKGLEDTLRRQLELEALVVAVTARFVGTDSLGMEQEIEWGLGMLATALGADRAHFLRGNQSLDHVTYFEWIHPERGQQPPEPDPRVRDWWFDMMRAGVTLQLDDVAELADEYPEVIANLKNQGVRSLLHVPLPFQRSTWGFVALVTIDRPLGMDDDLIALVQLAGESFMTALARADDGAALLDARRELEFRNRELERSNEELERFAYSASHDLKAPLARIEMALAATPNPEGDAGRLMDVARRGAARMRRLIEDLLTFASVGTGTGTPGDVDLDDVLTQVLADLAPTIDSTGATIARHRLPPAWGHRSLLGQLLQNLVGNALKFTRADIAPFIDVSGTGDDEGITIRVTDNGIGIEPRHRTDVFGVFTRLNADEHFPGSGIGLATCAKVVAHHEGQISVEEGIDGGTTVVVRLPHRPLRA